jgi:hypothetical protein
MLALAHYVERLVEEGAVASYADAARQLGVSRARMSQILNLLNLSPRVQEALLLGELHLSERRVRTLAARADGGQSGTWVTLCSEDMGNTLSDKACWYGLQD